MHDLPSSLPFEMQNRFKGYSDRLDKAFEDLNEHPEYLVDLFQAIAGNEKAREISADWTHRFVTRLIEEKTYPTGTAGVIRTLESNGLLNHSEQERLAIRAIEEGMLEGLEPLLKVLGGINSMLAGMTPLHWACRFGQLKIAEFLTEQGASWSRLNIYGEEPIALADPEKLAPFQLLEQTTFPTGIDREAMRVFKSYREVTPNTLDHFLKLFEQDPIPARQLTWLKEHAPMVQLIFQQKYALNPNDPLIRKGLAFCQNEKIITEDITDLVQRYESMMTTRNVAHIIGDATLSGVMEDKQELEGHLMSQTIPLLQAIIGRIVAKYGERLDLKTKEALAQVNRDLVPALSRSMEAEALCIIAKGLKPTDQGEHLKAAKPFAAQFLTELQKVPPNGMLILPWGWRSTSSGHAMLMNFKRTANATWTIDVLNTGDGMQFGSSMIFGGKEKYRFLTAFENVTDNELLDSFFLERLLEPQFIAQDIGAADLYLAILDKRFGHHKRQPTADDADVSDFITGQRSGTCAFRVLSSFMRLRLGKDEYKKFKHFMHLETATAAFHVNREAFRDKPARRRLLQDGLANVARQALKLHKGGLLTEPEFRCSSEQIRNLHTEMMTVAPVTSGHSLEVVKSERILGSRQVKAWMDQLTVPFPDLTSQKNEYVLMPPGQAQVANDLVAPCTNAQELLKGVRAFSKLDDSMEMPIIFANFFLDVSFPEATFIQSIKQLSVDDAKKLLDALHSVEEKAKERIFRPFPNVILAFQIVYGLAYTIACHIDERSETNLDLNLNRYQPDPVPLKILRKNPHIILGDPRLEDKAFQLQKYFEDLATTKPNVPLFSFLNWKVIDSQFQAGLALPPPEYSSEDRFMKALKRTVGDWNPRYGLNYPVLSDIDRKEWYDATLFDLLTPEKTHIAQYRRIYLQSRLCLFSSPKRGPFELQQIYRTPVWVHSHYTREPKELIARELLQEEWRENDFHRHLYSLDHELPVLDRTSENKVCIFLHPELRSLWSVRSQAEVTLPRLLQHFEEHPSNLEDTAVQDFFLLTLCHYGEHHLRDEGLRNPLFKKRLQDFIEKRALPFFQHRLLGMMEQKDLEKIAMAAIFLLVTQGRVAIYFDDDEMFQRSIATLRTWASSEDARCPPLFKQTAVHWVVNQSLIQTLMLKPSWTNAEAECALIAFATSTYCTDNEKITVYTEGIADTWKDPRREFDVKNAFWQHREELFEKLSHSDFRQKVLTAMVYVTPIPYEFGEWSGSFPVYTAQLKGVVGKVDVNILKGAVYLNGVQMYQPESGTRAGFFQPLKDAFGRDIMDNLLLILLDYPATYSTIKKPEKNDISLLTYMKPTGERFLTIIKIFDNVTVEVDCRGRPFQFIQRLPNNDQKLVHDKFPIRYGNNEVIFAVSVDNGPRNILVMDRKLNRIGMLTHEGLWIQNPDDPNSEALPIAVNDKLEIENQNGWKREEGSDPDRVVLRKFDAAKKNYSTVELTRDQTSGRLIWKGERGVRYFLSENQTLAGLGQRTDYIVLEDNKGKRKVYFLGQKLYDIDRLTNSPRSSHPEENARFAQYAMKQGEYVEALYFLDQMTLSPVLGYEALKELQNIFAGTDKDENPNSIPLRIKAAYIAMQAMRKRPFLDEERRALAAENRAHPGNEDKIPVFDYWSEKQSALGPPLVPALIGYFSKYFSVETNIDEQLKLPQSIGKEEVTSWLLDLIQKNETNNPALLNALLALVDANRGIAMSAQLEPIDFSALKKYQYFYLSWRDLQPQKDAITEFSQIFPKLRPGKKFKDAFNFLYLAAMKGSDKDREMVQQVIDAMHQGADANDRFLIAILDAILHPQRYYDLSDSIRLLVDAIFEEKNVTYYGNPNDARFEKLKTKVDTWLKLPKAPLKIDERSKLEADLAEKIAATDDFNRLQPLPLAIPASVSGRAAFNTRFPIAPFAEVRSLLVEVPVEEATIESLTPPPFDSEYAERRFNAQNKDYQKGQLLNRHSHYKIDDSALPAVVKTFRQALDKANAQDLKTPFVELANYVPPGSLAEEIQTLEKIGRVRTELTADDCILAFLREDTQVLRKRNPHLSQDDANKIRQMVGEYLCHTLEVWRLRQCLERAEAIQSNNNPALRDDLVELFRQSLDGKSEYEPTEFPAILVFEYYGSEFLQSFVRLQPNQVQAIKDMTHRDLNGSYPNVAIQRIMGAGKTFVFGTVMALLKADGYHLSMHVPPSALFGTNTTDMLQRVVRFFQQRGHALHFTRASEHFDEAFLKNLHKTLHNAVLNREVILASPETLLSFRNRYIEMRDRVIDLHAARASAEAIGNVERPLRTLEDILLLLRNRGVATLDEIDVTLAPNKEHNFPVGDGRKLDSDANLLIEKIFFIAATDPEIEPILKLKENQQSHLNLEQRKKICSLIAYKLLDYLVHDDKWKGRLLLWVVPTDEKKAEIETLHDYLMDEDLDPPPLLQELHNSNDPLQKQLAEYIILLRKELRDWLPQGWERNLQEHYGRSHKDPNYPLARPYLANNTPNETSEFADRWEMINRTFHTYLVEGFNKGQMRAWITLLREEAEAEWALEEGAKGLDELTSVIAFKKITGKSLFEFDIGNDEHIAEIQKVFVNGTVESITTILNHARQSILDQVEMPLRQVSSNAQSLCSMFKTTQGYAGTMECADTFPEKIYVQFEEGTNGKTVDLLHRKKSPIHIIKDEKELLRQVIAKHPHMERVHAIIDVGAYFRGQSNATVARQIAELHSKVKGVIYFDEETNWPTFIFSNDPDHPITLPAMDPQTISLATGLSIDELFTYYDQRNITGVDIKQSFDAIAIATISENTSIRDVLQGVGRMRGLQYSQQVKFVVTESVASIIKNVNVHNLIVFTGMNETAQQMRYNLHSVILKLNNAAQEVVLEAIFSEPSQRRKNELYAAARTLFTKVIEAELYSLYAEKAKPVSTLIFLDEVRKRLMDTVRPVVMATTASNLETAMTQIVESAKAKMMLPATVDVSQALDASREATMEQEQTRVQEQERKQEQKKEVVQTAPVSKDIATESGWSRGVVKDPAFPRCPGCPAVNTLQSEMNGSPELRSYAALFDANIDITRNFKQTKITSTQLLTANSKEAYIILAIQQEGQWRFMLGSLHDMAQLRKQIEADGKQSPLSIYMINPNGKLVTDGKGDWKDPSDPKGPLMQGLVQIMIFQGNVKTLNNPLWLTSMQHWLSTGNQDLKKDFIENHALRTPEMKQFYQDSRLREAVNATYNVETDDLSVKKVLSRIEDASLIDANILRHYLGVLQQVHPTVNVRKGIEIIVERLHRVPPIIQRPEPPKVVEEEPKPEGYLSNVWKWLSK